MRNIRGNLPCVLMGLLFIGSIGLAQGNRDKYIHDRGMLHQTVYNMGMIGKPWYKRGVEITEDPIMEWPGNSKTTIIGIPYSGQHCMPVGAGVYIAANVKGRPFNILNREFSFCGGVGEDRSEEQTAGIFAFPVEFSETENFPVLEDGSLNPDYDPNEAEETIRAVWATNSGLTVTRISRSWSYPDFDDMIIYEYEFVYTGDTDGNPTTIERPDSTLTDVMIAFAYGWGPSMLGYQRNYGEWRYQPGLKNGDNWGWFDPDYWLYFNMDHWTEFDSTRKAKPEPDPELFREFAETGKNGGGLLSPQAPGVAILYYDTEHLAVMDTTNPELSESMFAAKAHPEDLDENLKVRQPWAHQHSSAGHTLDWIRRKEYFWPDRGRPGSRFGTGPDDDSTGYADTRWLGHSSVKWYFADNNVARTIIFGPYTLEPGDNAEFSYAEVMGYGGAAGKMTMGGNKQVPWNPIPSLDRKVVLDGQVMTEHYLTDYGYPDYINSDVRNVQDVAHKAFEAYLGIEIPYDTASGRPVAGGMWPEDYNMKDGSYAIPVPPPAPAITVKSTEVGTVRLTWNRAVENFTHPHLTEPVQKYHIYRSEAYIGPWTHLKSITVGDVMEEGIYRFIDDDESFKVGENRFYAVTADDDAGHESGKTNITSLQKQVGSVVEMEKVHVVPNPFYVKSGFVGDISKDPDNTIGFYGLPEVCTIRIYSYAGQLIDTIEHNTPSYSKNWILETQNNQLPASGIYFYVVTTPEGDQTAGKFLIIR